MCKMNISREIIRYSDIHHRIKCDIQGRIMSFFLSEVLLILPQGGINVKYIGDGVREEDIAVSLSCVCL